MHLFHTRFGERVLIQNQTWACLVTVPPLIAVQTLPQ